MEAICLDCGARRPQLKRDPLDGLPLQREYEPKASTHRCKDLSGHLACPLAQIRAVQRYKLRDVRHRVLRKSRHALWHQYIARRVQETQVGCQYDRDCGLDSTTIKRIVLHDQQGSPKPRLRADRLAQVRPPDLAPLDYHSVRATMRRWARRVALSN
jgi:hypothetical protein